MEATVTVTVEADGFELEFTGGPWFRILKLTREQAQMVLEDAGFSSLVASVILIAAGLPGGHTTTLPDRVRESARFAEPVGWISFN